MGKNVVLLRNQSPVQNFHTGNFFSTVSSYLSLVTCLVYFSAPVPITVAGLPGLTGASEGMVQQIFSGWLKNPFSSAYKFCSPVGFTSQGK